MSHCPGPDSVIVCNYLCTAILHNIATLLRCDGIQGGRAAAREGQPGTERGYDDGEDNEDNDSDGDDVQPVQRPRRQGPNSISKMFCLLTT